MGNTLNIAINAQIASNGGTGGVESIVVGLVSALGRLEGPERYKIVVPWNDDQWLAKHLGSNQEIVIGPGRPRSPAVAALFRVANRSRTVRKLWHDHVEMPRRMRPPISGGFFESLGCDVVHFPYQVHQICAVPTIFNPHDLQHRHLPQFFKAEDIAERDARYWSGCRFARTIVVGSDWVKRDIVAQYGIHPEKIQIIPWAAPTQVHGEPGEDQMNRAVETFKLNRPFFYYPAMTWPHKNHLRLLEAFSKLVRETKTDMDLVCSGSRKTVYWPVIENRIRELGLEARARFLGMVPREDLRCLYRRATAVIVPTLFEAASGPVFEAWADCVPVACSNVTSLPEQAAGAALIFDPYSVDSIFDAMLRLARDTSLRQRLVAAGERRLSDFDWERTAKAYRAVYRRAANRDLSEEDVHILSSDWMKSPHNSAETEG